MTQETNENPRNNHSIISGKANEKLPSSTHSADNNFCSFDVGNCINDVRRSIKKNAKQTWQQYQQIAKRLLNVEDSIVKNIDPCKMRKPTKYLTTVKSIPGGNNRGNNLSHQMLYG